MMMIQYPRTLKHLSIRNLTTMNLKEKRFTQAHTQNCQIEERSTTEMYPISLVQCWISVTKSKIIIEHLLTSDGGTFSTLCCAGSRWFGCGDSAMMMHRWCMLQGARSPRAWSYQQVGEWFEYRIHWQKKGAWCSNVRAVARRASRQSERSRVCAIIMPWRTVG